MKNKKTKTIKKYKPLPPHTWESHPLAKEAEVKKPLLIALISIGAIIVLALILFFAQKAIVGKAAYIGGLDSIGFDRAIYTPNINESFSVVVGANIGAEETVATSFIVNFPEDLTCLSVTSLLGWEDLVLETAECDNIDHQVIFEYATVDTDFSEGDLFDLAQIDFAGISTPGNYDLVFDSFEIIKLSDDSVMINLIPYPAIVTVAEVVDLAACQVACDALYAPADPAHEVCYAACEGPPAAEPCLVSSDCTIAGQTCENGFCVAPLAVTCATDNDCPTGEVCDLDTGTCIAAAVDLCAGVICDEGFNCDPVTGICIAEIVDLCADVTCDEGFSCDSETGECAALVPQVECDPACGENEQCVDGECVAVDPCADVTCDEGFSCDSETGECVEEEPVDEEEPTTTGGRRRCISTWQCSTWSYCDASLEQTRSCIDLKCNRPERTETRDCEQCLESWICTEWSACQNNRQVRECEDQHLCGTTARKPVLTKSCTQTRAPGPRPDRIVPQAPARVPPPPAEPSFWKENIVYLIAIPSAIVLILVSIFLVLHFTKRPHVTYNYDELKEWIKKERAMGTSNEDIKDILADQTGWSEKEIEQAFTSLQTVEPQVQEQERPSPEEQQQPEVKEE